MTSKRSKLACQDLETDSAVYVDDDDRQYFDTNILQRRGPVADEGMDSDPGYKSFVSPLDSMNSLDSMDTLDSSLSQMSLNGNTTNRTTLTTTTGRMSTTATPALLPVPETTNGGMDEDYGSMGESTPVVLRVVNEEFRFLKKSTPAVRVSDAVLIANMSSTPAVSAKDAKLSDIIKKCVVTLRRDPNILVSNLCRQDSERNSVLHWTIALGWVQDSLAIINCMPDISFLETRNDLRQTPLILALLTQDSVVVEALVKAGVDLTLLDRHGDSCFHIAAKTGDLDSLIILGKRMTPQLLKLVNQQNASGLAPVHIAVQEGHIHIFEQLKRFYKADVNRRDGRAGYTPLHHAIRTFRETNMNMIVYLVQQAKADLTVADYSRRTPIMMADGYRCLDLVAYLRRKGTKEDSEWLNCPPFSDDSDSDEENTEDESESEGISR